MKILSLITPPHVIPKLMTIVHPWDTNYDIFDALRELSDPSIDSKDPYTIKARKRSKEMDKIIHVTSVVQL